MFLSFAVLKLDIFDEGRFLPPPAPPQFMRIFLM